MGESMPKKVLIVKVLVVDDDKEMIDFLTDMLSAEGYEVVVAFDAIQGIQFTHREKPDVVILDLVMPAGGGFKTLESLKESTITREIPIIVLTGKGTEEDKKKVLEMGADDYIRKPFDPELLIKRIKELTS
jgi:DNA-binding response OmpR family regulator